MSSVTLDLISPPQLSVLTADAEASATAFKAYLNSLPDRPAPDELAPLQQLLAFFDTAGHLQLPAGEDKLDPLDVLELKKTAFLVFQLDFLFLLYYLQHQDELAETEAPQKYREKVLRLQILAHTLAQHPSDESADPEEA